MQPFAILYAALTAALFGVLVLCGRRQRREGAATWSRLLAIGALGASLATTPLLVALAIGGTTGDLSALISVHRVHDDGTLTPIGERVAWGTSESGVNALVALLASALLARWWVAWLGPVGRLVTRGQDLPRLSDEATLARVRELSAALGTRVPQVLCRKTLGGSLDAWACAGGLVATTLVVSDGILHRFTPAERDAILAHELAHLRRGSVSIYIAISVLAVLLATLASAFTSPWVAAALCVALPLGLWKVWGHFDEPACDLRAAHVLGFATAAMALDKTHVIAAPDRGALSALFHATQTHPSIAVRLAALHSAAPPQERDTIGVDQRTARAHRRLNALSLALWVAAIATAVWAGAHAPLVPWATGLLLLVVFTPPVVRLLLTRRDLLDAWRLGYLTSPLAALAPALPIALVIGTLYAAPALDWIGVPLLVALSLAVAVAIWLAWRARRRRAHVASFASALAAHEARRALALFDRLPARARRRPELRRMRAMAQALGADRGAAIRELEAILRDAPRHHAARLELIALTVARDPNGALAHLDVVERSVRGTKVAALTRAAILRRLGRLREAQAELRRVPAEAHVSVLEARIVIASGDLARADAALALAERRDPGDAGIDLARIELALARGEHDVARATLERARERARNQPFAWWITDDLQALERRIETSIDQTSRETG